MLVIALICVATGALVYATWQAKRHARALAEVELERDIIRAAMLCRGQITALDVKTRHPSSVAEIETRMRSLASSGYCERRLVDDGQQVYVFQAFDDAPLRALALERQILLLAQLHNGRVPVLSVVRALDLSYAEARRKLEDMAAQKICSATGEHDVFWFYTASDSDAPIVFESNAVRTAASTRVGGDPDVAAGAKSADEVAAHPRSLGGPSDEGEPR